MRAKLYFVSFFPTVVAAAAAAECLLEGTVWCVYKAVTCVFVFIDRNVINFLPHTILTPLLIINDNQVYFYSKCFHIPIQFATTKLHFFFLFIFSTHSDLPLFNF